MTLLPTRMVEKPWGRNTLPAPFVAPARQRVGEVWFEPPPELPQLLVKYIFTSDKLSVQVHPSDAQLPGYGKEECWLVIAAEPGASLGIGFREPISSEAMRAAALDGSIEQLLVWHAVKAGDFFYIPAGTVHAIGAGVSLIEVQQTSDVTYRLYDYGRPRALHLDEGIAVALGEVYPDWAHRNIPDRGLKTLVDGPLFQLDRIDGSLGGGLDQCIAERYACGPLLVIPQSGGVSVAEQAIAPGSCAVANSCAEIAFSRDSLCLIAQPLAGKNREVPVS